MVSAQTRLDSAILAHEQAAAEVERLCDIVQRAVNALDKARQMKRDARKELDTAARSQPRSSGRAHPLFEHVPEYERENASGKDTHEDPSEYSAEDSEASSEEGESEESESDEGEPEEAEPEEEESEEGESEKEEDQDEDVFDVGNEALEQIRYRLEIAKIDPNSARGAKLLDELLIRLQDTKEAIIDTHLINKLIDESLFETKEQDATAPQAAAQNDRKPPPPPPNPKHRHLPRIRIHRGGEVLGYYQGQLDERGYAREGSGSMYYDVGHECHGTWQRDEMIGRGVYQWSDGHVYDGEWLNGKRHGLGRFVRPDNVVLYGRYEKGHHKGEGARWSADRKEAQVMVDGVPKKTVSLAKAKEIVTNLGFDDVLPPSVS